MMRDEGLIDGNVWGVRAGEGGRGGERERGGEDRP